MAEVARLCDFCCFSADSALINMPSGTVGVASRSVAVQASAGFANPVWVWLAEDAVKVAAINLTIHRTRAISFAGTHCSSSRPHLIAQANIPP
jgi:hypothetical protein